MNIYPKNKLLTEKLLIGTYYRDISKSLTL